jgi:glycosyltransferase involved in cell wall biosynthesis
MNRLFRALDKFCYENSDVVWNLSTAISETRHNRLGGNLKDQKNIIVPLTYSSKLLTFRPLEEIERQSIAFIGTLEKLQGLQLLIKAMPEVLTYLPNVIVKVIGDGPYAKELKELVSDSGLNEHFHFYGFVKKESDVIDVVSRCAVGVAPFIPVPENNALTADPGKPKFYAFCGLPIVITKIPSGLLIDKEGAGIAIEYDPHELANAVIRLLQDARLLARYRRNANRFAQSYTSERIFRDAFKTTLRCFQEQDLRYSQGGGYK